MQEGMKTIHECDGATIVYCQFTMIDQSPGHKTIFYFNKPVDFCLACGAGLTDESKSLEEQVEYWQGVAEAQAEQLNDLQEQWDQLNAADDYASRFESISDDEIDW